MRLMAFPILAVVLVHPGIFTYRRPTSAPDAKYRLLQSQRLRVRLRAGELHRIGKHQMSADAPESSAG